MEPSAYLERIGISMDSLHHDGSIQELARIHEHHLLSIPFENVEVALGVPIVLDVDAFVRKIVQNRRGGFCYELNGAFAALLRSLGYRVSLLNAQVARPEGGFGIDYDHLTLAVESPRESGRVLADVGFGDSFRRPIPIYDGAEVVEGSLTYRLCSEGNALVLKRRDGRGHFEPRYRFTQMSETLDAFKDGCKYHQSSPDSSFTNRLVCTIAEPGGGRTTLSETRLIRTTAAGRDEWAVEDPQAFVDLFVEYFGFLPEQAERCRPLFQRGLVGSNPRKE